MIYVIHFSRRLHHARHYIGFCDGDESAVARRLEKHRTKKGARILAACVEKGIRFRVVAILPGNRYKERRLKRHKNGPRFCPLCRRKKRTR